jgi:hypothetical protein
MKAELSVASYKGMREGRSSEGERMKGGENSSGSTKEGGKEREEERGRGRKEGGGRRREGTRGRREGGRREERSNQCQVMKAELSVASYKGQKMLRFVLPTGDPYVRYLVLPPDGQHHVLQVIFLRNKKNPSFSIFKKK